MKSSSAKVKQLLGNGFTTSNDYTRTRIDQNPNARGDRLPVERQGWYAISSCFVTKSGPVFMPRTASIDRKTSETDIQLELNLDGSGVADVATGVGFLDHMLTLFAKHGVVDLKARATGDLEVDQHHTVEDVGICLGQAIREAVGDKAGIRRYGHFTLPMDETLVTVAIDLSGRHYLVYNAPTPANKIGEFDTELLEEFWQAVSANALCNLHVVLHHGLNSHHISEAVFKATARAMRMAVEQDPRCSGVPSTKGTLDK